MNRKTVRLIRLLFIAPIILVQFETAAQSKPDLFTAIDSLAKFIASEQFRQIATQTDALSLIDTIWYKSLQISADTSDALLSAAFSTLPFKVFPVKTPLTGTRFDIPLPTGPINLFSSKFNNLPSNFLFDSPSGFGDRDKLPHFFGNAFLTYNFGFFTITKFMGIFVELFEYNFKKNGEVSLRDMRVNYLGGLFGLILRTNPRVKPSDLLKIYNIFYLRVF